MNGSLHFAPSRFVGYKGVTFNKHQTDLAAEELDGRLTNPAISKALNKVPLIQDLGIDAAYKNFLLNILGSNISPYNVRRKFWLTDAADKAVVIPDEPEMDLIGLSKTVKAALVFARIGQNRFRTALIRKWRACPVSGSKQISVLQASHIKPWNKSTNEERVDPDNGLLLAPTLHVLFDLGLITFDQQGIIMCSKLFSVVERKLLLPSAQMQITLNKKQGSYLAYHRKNVFIRNRS